MFREGFVQSLVLSMPVPYESDPVCKIKYLRIFLQITCKEAHLMYRLLQVNKLLKSYCYTV